MLKSGVSERQGAITEAATVVLALEHHFYPALVFEPSGFRIDTDFPSVGVVSPDSPVEDEFVVLGEFRVFADFRDGAPAEGHTMRCFAGRMDSLNMASTAFR